MTTWDLSAVLALYHVRTVAGVDFFTLVTNLGGAAVVIVVFVLAFLVLERSDRWQYGVGMMVSLASSLAVSDTIKNLVQRARPPLSLHAIYEVDYSFPSNHATAAMALYGFLAYAIWKCTPRHARVPLTFICALVIVLVGFSRVYLGVHYPSDVIAGYVVGLLAMILGTHVTKRLLRFA